MLTTQTQIIDAVNVLMHIMDDAEDSQIETIVAHASDVVAKGREKLQRRAELDNRLFWKDVPEA